MAATAVVPAASSWTNTQVTSPSITATTSSRHHPLRTENEALRTSIQRVLATRDVLIKALVHEQEDNARLRERVRELMNMIVRQDQHHEKKHEHVKAEDEAAAM